MTLMFKLQLHRSLSTFTSVDYCRRIFFFASHTCFQRTAPPTDMICRNRPECRLPRSSSALSPGLPPTSCSLRFPRSSRQNVRAESSWFIDALMISSYCSQFADLRRTAVANSPAAWASASSFSRAAESACFWELSSCLKQPQHHFIHNAVQFLRRVAGLTVAVLRMADFVVAGIP